MYNAVRTMGIVVTNAVVRIKPNDAPLFSIRSFQANSGESILIKGASGKGKTTFLHLLAGLFLPDEGEVFVDNVKLSDMDEASRCIFRRTNIGIVFQKLNLIEHLTPIENIELSVRKGKSNQRAVECLEVVGLQGREHDKVSCMSLGEQQRVAIARALVGDFKIILADEPTSSLDEKNAIAVTKLLLQASQNKTLIVVSHDHRIEQFYSRVLDFEELISHDTN